jgi:hypothetical protein
MVEFLINKIGAKTLKIILTRLSPILILVLQEQLDKLKTAAGKSKNPYDDILVKVIQALV